ncbi:MULTISPECIES: hypothetical protein [unclassified Streptomyces]|uniref:hypothetical protein n=1 Tax=unclassified Streptomyces TaxID=2593676 RepID=UPI003807BD37
MNVQRILTAVAAGSALLAAAAPAAQAAPAFDLGGTLVSTAQTAAAVGSEAAPVLEGVTGGKVARKVGAVKDVVQAGADAAKATHDLVS